MARDRGSIASLGMGILEELVNGVGFGISQILKMNFYFIKIQEGYDPHPVKRPWGTF